MDGRIKAARFPDTKSLDTSDFLAMPFVKKRLVMQLARCEYEDRRVIVITGGNSDTGATHVALGWAGRLTREAVGRLRHRRIAGL